MMICTQICFLGLLFTVNGYKLQCPHSSQRAFRIQNVCNGNSSSYNCLFDTRKKTNIEFCTDRKDNYVRPGLKYVISGTFRNVRCSDGRYQPFIFWSNQDNACLFSKAQCMDIGQIVYDNRSTIVDASCRCDYERGYAYVSEPRNQCFCIPSEEDCSCYKKKCSTNTTLSPYYECTSITNENVYCQPVTNRQQKDNGIDMAFSFQNNHDNDHEQYNAWRRSGRTGISIMILGFSIISGILVVVYLVHDCTGVLGKNNTMLLENKNIQNKKYIDIQVQNREQYDFTGCETGNQYNQQHDEVYNIENSISTVSSSNLCNMKSAKTGRTPLMDACVSGHMSIVISLIQRDADINSTDNDGNTPFLYSCHNGNIDIVNLLIDKGCDIHKPNNDGTTPLMDACDRGHLSIVNRLIELGADINITDKDGDTSFSWACLGCNIDIVNLLKGKGCDIHKPNNNGKTPLMDACDRGHLSIVNRLIELGADINITNKREDTPFTWSCLGGNIDIVNLLIDKGCDIHKPNNQGKTALMVACGKGHLSIVNRLIEMGADIYATDDNGRTPFNWSCIGGNIDIVNLLSDKGSNKP